MTGHGLFPPWVAVADAACSAADVPHAECPPPLRHALRSRRLEFAAGRRAAAEAIRELGMANAPVGLGDRGEPLWPPGVVGSITHCEGRAWSAAARARDASALGFDVEPRIDRQRAARVRDEIVSPAELTAAGWPLDFDDETRLTVAFSAKEALYKCLYPLVSRTFDFLDVTVVQVGSAARSITLRLDTTLSGAWRSGVRLDGRFAVDGSRVATAFVLTPGAGRTAGAPRR